MGEPPREEGSLPKHPKKSYAAENSGVLQKVSLKIVGSLETFFFNWGHSIARRPYAYIVGCLLISLVCTLGTIRFTPENRPDKLWIPWNSDFVKDSDWLRKNFPSPIRFHFAIITAEDVLQPAVIQQLQDIHEKVTALKTGVFEWKDVCFKLPVTKFGSRRRRKRQVALNSSLSASTEDSSLIFDFDDEDFDEDKDSDSDDPDFDPSVSLSQDLYCEILAELDEECWESNIAEMWGFDKNIISALTKDAILDVVNNKKKSPVFGRPMDYAAELGDVKRNSNGTIVQAGAIMLRWFAKINQTALKLGKIENDLGTGENVDKTSLLWEKELSDFFLGYQLPEGMKLYFNVARSFGDISGATIMGDAAMLGVGFSIVFIYVILMLGQFNMVELRPWLSLAGLGCVGLAIGVSYGICSVFKIIYGPVHNILPFLLLGIGIDDMFVIMQCWNNLSPGEMKRPLAERMGLTLQHAGVSITVTSVTDFVAFGIGATTVLPALQSFCVYAALGVFATYIFQATFFVACFVLDQQRIEDSRNSIFPFYKHENFISNSCSRKNYAQLFFDKVYSKILFKKGSKVLVFIVTFTILGVNIWGNTELRQEFNPIWFLPQDSYLFQYFSARDKFFPGRGDEGFILMQNVSLSTHLTQLDTVVQKLESHPQLHEIEAWYSDFKNYVNKNFKKDVPSKTLTEKEFHKLMGRFLFSPSGAKYRGRVKLDGNLTCGSPVPPILISSMGFKFKIFKDPDDHIPVMNEIKGLVRSTFPASAYNRTFVFSLPFAGWETDEIITAELYRNLALAMICVLITTLILIANLSTCLMVLTCVVFTLVNVGGSMHFWNLTIDTVSCIDLVLAIGLCVDYAAHIGHAFMTCTGTKDERARQALVNIGPAVLNGGFSTFLAFVLLANSKSHVFITFFKIFFLVVVYGLFHGLVFLPVLLSLLGPSPYPSALEKVERHDSHYSGQTVPLKSLPVSSSLLEVKNGHIAASTQRNCDSLVNEDEERNA